MHHHHWISVLKGFEIYLILCALSVAVGRGLARLLKLKTDERAEPALAAVLTYVIWAVAVGLIAGIGIALKAAAPWLWGASGLLAVFGLLPPWPKPRVFLPSLLLCAALPVASMLHTFHVGLTECPNSLLFDGFFYAASGEYAWEHGLNDYRNYEVIGPPLGPDACMKIAVWEHGPSDQGDLNMIHQFAATFPGHRCIGMSLLAFLSPLVHAGDTIADGPLLHAWSLFSLAAAVLLYWIARGKPAAFVFPATALAVAAGWTVAPFWANQLDNGLCLPYLAALAAILELWGPESRSRWLLLGITLAGLWYVYPPGAPFVMVAAALVALPRLWRERAAWQACVAGSALALVLCLVLWAPGGLGSIPYLRSSYYTRGDMSGLVPGIDHLKCYPSAFWGLGGETAAKNCSKLSNLIGAIFSCLAAVGVVRLARKGEWGVPLCVLFICGFCFYSLFRLHYSYPFLKLFSVSWWCFTALVVAGAAAVAERVSKVRYRSVLIGLLIVLGCHGQFYTALWHRNPMYATRFPDESVTTLRRVGSVCKELGKGSLMVAIDDWLPNLSAAYYLRDKDFYLATPRDWLAYPTFTLFQKRFHQVGLDGVRYVLSGSEGNADISRNADLVWSAGAYKLWRLNLSTDSEPTLIHVVPGIDHSKNGYADSFCVGAIPTVVYVASGQAGATDFRFVCLPREHLVDTHGCHVAVTTNKGYRGSFFLGRGNNSLSIPLTAGVNRVEFAVVDPARPGTPGQDHDFNLMYMESLQMSAATSRLTRG